MKSRDRRRRRGGKSHKMAGKKEIKDMGTVAWEKKLQRDKVKQQEKVKKDGDIPGSLYLFLMSVLCRNIFFFFLYLLIIALSFHGCSQNWGLLRASVAHIYFCRLRLLSLFFPFSASHSLSPSVCPFTLTHIATNYSNFRRVVSLLRHTVHQTTPTYGRQDIHTVNGAGQICYCTAEYDFEGSHVYMQA